MKRITFEQLPLVTGGYSLLTVELTLHISGRSDQCEVGYEIRSTDTGDTVELGTLGILGSRHELHKLALVLHQLLNRAEEHLEPF